MFLSLSNSSNSSFSISSSLIGLFFYSFQNCLLVFQPQFSLVRSVLFLSFFKICIEFLSFSFDNLLLFMSMLFLFISFMLELFLLFDNSGNFIFSFLKQSLSSFLFLMSLSDSFLHSNFFNWDLAFNFLVLFYNLWVYDSLFDDNLFDNLYLLVYLAFFWVARRMALFWLANWCNWLALFWSTWWVAYIWCALSLSFWFTIIFSDGNCVAWSNQKWKDKGGCSHLLFVVLKF